MKRLTLLLGVVFAYACGDGSSLELSAAASANVQPLELFDHPPHAQGSAIWGTEIRDVRGGYRTHDLVVFISSESDACANYPASLGTPGASNMLLRLSKLDRRDGHVTFVEPDAGSYPVEPPSQPAPEITRGSEITFHTVPKAGGDADVWLAQSGGAHLDARESGIVSGSFGASLVPFSLDGDTSESHRWMDGDFEALPCSAMNETAL